MSDLLQQIAPIRVVLRLILLPLAIFWLVGCEKQQAAVPVASTEAAAPPVPIQTSPVELRSVPSYLAVTGELKAGRTSTVAADAAGKVEETMIERGTAVNRGDVLVRLDQRAAKLALREAEAALKQAQVRFDLARSDWQRNEQLSKSKLIAPAETQKLKADVHGREADVAAAEARRDSALKALEDTEVRAPFAGVIVERLTNPGEYLQAGSKVATMISRDDLRLWMNVPETAAGNIVPDQKVAFRVPAFPGADFFATVRYISPIVRDTGRDLLVEAEVDPAQKGLLQGMFAEVRVSLKDRSALGVPASAIRKESGVHKVLVVDGDHLTERIVDIGTALDRWMEVRNGLAAGESVVLQPNSETRDGVRFTVATR